MPTELSLPADFAACPHDRGPGIAVCLRCRADANRRDAAARRRLATRLGIGAVVTLVTVAAASSGVIAMPGTRAAARVAPPAAPSARVETFQVTPAGAAEPGPARVADSTASTATSVASLSPLVAPGRTPLADGMYAERAGDSVSVHFDRPMLRTRHREKFEQVVRATLPALYGATADSALAAVPAGEFAAAGDLLAELPLRGVELPARDGWTITVWPATRPGKDGPLVVSYRTSVAHTR